MSAINSKTATVALIFGHIAGMIDLAALPVWVGTLSAGFGFGNTLGGGLVTAFLIGVVLASVGLARVFHKLSGRWMAPAGYAISAASFLAMWQAAPAPETFFALHLLAGLATGVALSTTHGTMGKTVNPHRLFAFGHAGFGLFAVLFLGGAPKIIAASGPATLFLILGLIMASAALVTALAFPKDAKVEVEVDLAAVKRLPVFVWMVIAGILLMNLNQAMTFSFVERIGMERGFGIESVQLVLLVLGIVNLFPSLLAALLERRLKPLEVGMAGVGIQALFALFITLSDGFWTYAIPTVFFAAVMIFSHTFLFGFLAKTDPSGRAVAATPAMTMAGSAIAPLLGGFLSDSIGYGAIGVAVTLSSAVALMLFLYARTSLRAKAVPAVG